MGTKCPFWFKNSIEEAKPQISVWNLTSKKVGNDNRDHGYWVKLIHKENNFLILDIPSVIDYKCKVSCKMLHILCRYGLELNPQVSNWNSYNTVFL